jgi:hypothetical protein
LIGRTSEVRGPAAAFSGHFRTKREGESPRFSGELALVMLRVVLVLRTHCRGDVREGWGAGIGSRCAYRPAGGDYRERRLAPEG